MRSRGRPRKGVTSDNAQRVYLYFRDALKDIDRGDRLLVHPDHLLPAREAFWTVSKLAWCPLPRIGTSEILWSTTLPDPDELDQWVQTYISKKGWQLCQTNLRQYRHAAKTRSRTKQIKISYDNWYTLKQLSEASGLPLDDTLSDLLESSRDNEG